MFALGAFPSADAGVRLYYDVIDWPIDGVGQFGEEIRFTAAVLGAVMMGWAMTALALTSAAAQIGAPAWRGLTWALATWFAVDSVISIASGWPVNAVANAIFLTTFLIPVVVSGVLRSPVRDDC